MVPLGFVSFPYFWVIECFGPVIELGGYIYVIVALLMGNTYSEFAILSILLFILYGSILSMMTLILEAWSMNRYPTLRELMHISSVALTELVWYRPLTLFWRCEGIIRFMIRRHDWGSMERVGISEKESRQQ